MDFIRPELRALFAKWSEVIAGIIVMLAGMWNMLQPGWVLRIIGVVILLLGAAIAFAAWRRLKIPKLEDGPGVVEVDERQISYYGAYQGGSVSVDALVHVIVKNTAGDPSGVIWEFEQEDGSRLEIPSAATGADALFDAISALPGANYDAALRAMSLSSTDSVLVWVKDRKRLH